MDIIELAGTARHLFTGLRDQPANSSALGGVHFALHLPLDANHRVAIPIGFVAAIGERDVGGYFRPFLGLRWRPSQRCF